MSRLKENGRKQRAQASLELAFSLICLMVLVWGSFSIFLWLNKQMLNRQEYYADSRQKAAKIWVNGPYLDDGDIKEGWHLTSAGGKQLNKPDYPKLDVFKP